MEKVKNRPIRVYLGGKIGMHDWRSNLFAPEVNDINTSAKTLLANTQSMVCRRTIEGIDLQYAGPYFLGCDHGCYHYNQDHALGASWKWETDKWISGNRRYLCSGEQFITRHDAIQLCEAWLASANVMVIWASDDFHTAHGTHVEIGYARAKGIPILLMIDRKITPEYVREWWFAAESVNAHIFVDDPVEGFYELCADGYL